jgi:DNA-binding transcriptional ArsR family regulator
MADIRHRVGISAPAATVYQAVATKDGLAGWWTRDVRGEASEGGELLFYFGGPEPAVVMEVTSLEPDRHVGWRCVRGPEGSARTSASGCSPRRRRRCCCSRTRTGGSRLSSCTTTRRSGATTCSGRRAGWRAARPPHSPTTSPSVPAGAEGGVDEVFRALADPSRRQLLDSLNQRTGQTPRGLCAGQEMTRQSVSKHLAVLEAANLVTTVRWGRGKRHYLNSRADQRHRRPVDRPLRRGARAIGPEGCT